MQLSVSICLERQKRKEDLKHGGVFPTANLPIKR